MYQAELYNNTNDVARDDTRFVLEKYGHWIKFGENESILEVGIGGGRTTEEILLNFYPENAELTAVDISPEMVEFSRKNKKLRRIQIEELDISTPNLPDTFKDKFTHIFSFHAFQWVKDINQTLINTIEMLKTNGVVFLVLFSEAPEDKALEKMSKIQRWKKYETHKWCSTFYKKNINVLDRYVETMEKIGFVDIKSANDEHEVTVDWENMRNCYLAVNPALKNINEQDLNDYIEDYLDECFNPKYNEIFIAENGRKMVKMTCHLLTICARKK